MVYALYVLGWTYNKWYDSTRQHYDLLSHLETLSNIVLFSFLFLYQLLYISPSMYMMIVDYYCIWEKGYHCYSPSVAKSHMLMLLRYMILCFLAKISTYFSTVDYFFSLSFFGCLMRWSDWDGLDEEKKRLAYIFWLVDAVTVVMQK